MVNITIITAIPGITAFLPFKDINLCTECGTSTIEVLYYGFLPYLIPYLIPYLFSILIGFSRTAFERALTSTLLILSILTILFFEWFSYWTWINSHTLPDGTMRRQWWGHYLIGGILNAVVLGPLYFLWEMAMILSECGFPSDEFIADREEEQRLARVAKADLRQRKEGGEEKKEVVGDVL